MTRNKPTIIVADDDLTIRLVVGEALRQEGWLVVEAEDVAELDRLVRSGLGDLVLSDVMMPGGNGIDCMAERDCLHHCLRDDAEHKDDDRSRRSARHAHLSNHESRR